MTKDIVQITIGQLGQGEQTIELEPGESLREVFSEPGYVEITVAEVEEPEEIQVADTTYERDESGDGDREWEVKTTRCQGCGELYPKDYTRCPECGAPNSYA